jgi:hypothetical protein
MFNRALTGFGVLLLIIGCCMVGCTEALKGWQMAPPRQIHEVWQGPSPIQAAP